MPEPGDGRLPQHRLVEQRKPDPNLPAKRVLELVGLPGNSDRSGYQRLYLSTKLDYYAEFSDSDIVGTQTVPASDSPFPGYDATRVSIARDATIHYVRVRSPQPVDEFDLDVRLGAPAASKAPALISPANGCTDACHTVVSCATCRTCAGENTCAATCPNTCGQGATCQAAATCVGHGTCVATQCVAGANDVHNPCVYTNNQGNTCNTCAATCQTCFTACNQATCANTQCQQATCHTCAQVNTCAQTCVG